MVARAVVEVRAVAQEVRAVEDLVVGVKAGVGLAAQGVEAGWEEQAVVERVAA